ncbi:TetR/AcrR family transcriptional regulator [Planotetraspora mira]|uniref:Transcriptional regulator n=1 Tax=Planotetraspora mira TaxID=58121 RepID=A0A8J3X8F7_9ACTN|nr:TetR/AcrR family transcriptional regulator [Planotetraspora mira]GII31685.1 transcriptional regulator [Planotetraspora mira]
MSQQDDVPTPPWERPRKRQAPARIPLTRERIVDAAFVVLDRDGFDKLSMRQVAAELGVAVSALYVHVDDKDELLRLMYNRLFEGVDLPEPDPETWQEQIKDFARSGRERLLRHRDMARISMAHVPFTVELLPHIEKLFAILRAGGLPDNVMAIAGDLLSTYMDGFTLEENMWRERMSDASWQTISTETENYFASLPPDRFPNLVALADLMVGETNDYRFELGLDIIVRGLASYSVSPSSPDGDEAS